LCLITDSIEVSEIDLTDYDEITNSMPDVFVDREDKNLTHWDEFYRCNYVRLKLIGQMIRPFEFEIYLNDH
jgi:hypothetical protein